MNIELDAITNVTARDALRRAVADAAHRPVWITEDGKRIAAIVSIPMLEDAVRVAKQGALRPITLLWTPEQTTAFVKAAKEEGL